MIRSIARGLLAVAVLGGVLVGAPPSMADELDAKRRQAQALEERIRAQGQRLSMAAEDYNEARLERQRADEEAAGARVLVAEAESEWVALKQRLGGRARLLYMHPGAALEALFGARSLGELARARVYGGEVLLTDTKLVMAAERARHEVLRRAETLDSLRAEAARKESDLASRRQQVNVELSSQRTLLRSVRGEVAELLQAAQERQLAAARAAAAAAATPQPSPAQAGRLPSVQAPPSPRAAPAPEEPARAPPAARASAGKAVETARAQLGKPYQWGASGPDSFDCSGLTSYAWASAGVNLPHSSRAQYASLPKVARSQLQPGDLVFYGNPIHHVGIYEGGGVMINAPETGHNVRRNSIDRADYTGAARP